MFLTICVAIALGALVVDTAIKTIRDVRTHRFFFQRPDPPERPDA
jgi:hypothetical protein